MIRIICVGKIKESYLKDLINDYTKRISKYHKIEIIEIKDSDKLIIESKEILKYLSDTHYNIALTIDGTKMNSESFAKYIDNLYNYHSTINFVVGASNGLDKSVIDKCNTCISFSDFTFPHGLFRGILLEQIYRAFKINNNESYHK